MDEVRRVGHVFTSVCMCFRARHAGLTCERLVEGWSVSGPCVQSDVKNSFTFHPHAYAPVTSTQTNKTPGRLLQTQDGSWPLQDYGHCLEPIVKPSLA